MVLENTSSSITFKLWSVCCHRRYVITLILASLLFLCVLVLFQRLNAELAMSALAPEWSSTPNIPAPVTQDRPEATEQPRSTNLPSSSTGPSLSSSSTSQSSSALNVVEVVEPSSFRVQNETFDCITARLIDMTFPICVYAADTDIWVSSMLVRGGYFEREEVSWFMHQLQLDQRLQFVDIGANIGVYSLPIARLTQVLAVEPNSRSLARLAKAVVLGTVSSNITLVHNAISNVRTTVNMGVEWNNQGHTFLINGTECKSTDKEQPCRTSSQTTTVLLDDLLPLMRSTAALLKVDVESHEINVFTESSAGQFFEQIDVPLVLMEWVFHRNRSPEIVQRLLEFFWSRNYVAFDIRNFRLQMPYRNWPDNILFKKSSHITPF